MKIEQNDTRVLWLHVKNINDFTVRRLNMFWNRTRLVPSLKLFSSSWFLLLPKAFKNSYVAAFSAACRSATEKNEVSGYGTVLCLSKMTQLSSTSDSSDVTKLAVTEHVRNEYSLRKSRFFQCTCSCKLIDIVNLNLITAHWDQLIGRSLIIIS